MKTVQNKTTHQANDKHPAVRKAKANELKEYLRAQEDARAAQRDAERQLAQAYLLFRLYNLLQKYLSSVSKCEQHSVQWRVECWRW